MSYTPILPDESDLSDKEFKYLHSFICRTGRSMKFYSDFEDVVYESSEHSLASGINEDLPCYLNEVNKELKSA